MIFTWLRLFRCVFVALVCLCCSGAVLAASLEDCLAERVVVADDTVSVGELRRACSLEVAEDREFRAEGAIAETTGAAPVEIRQRVEPSLEQPFTLRAHRPTYLLPLSYNARVNDSFADGSGPVEDPERTEASFQISFKAPLWRDILGSGDSLFLAYTNRSYWQLYNQGGSSPFRSSDHEPEIFWRHNGEMTLGPVSAPGFDLGLNHQSNGRTEPLSRSWNRVLASTVLTGGDFALGLRGWLRIPEDEEDDDNPDIEDYMGYGEFRLMYAPNRNTFTLMARPSREGAAVEVTWSHALSDSVRLYLQYYNGFGETLIDYDHRVERYSLGIALNDYLLNTE